MTSLTKEFFIYYVGEEYKYYSNIILNLQNHINKSYEMGFLDISTRKRYLGILDGLVRILKRRNVKITKDLLSRADKRSKLNIQTLYSGLSRDKDIIFKCICERIYMSKLFDYKKDKLLTKCNFQNVHDKLMGVMKKVGFYSLDEVLKLLIGERYKLLYTKEDLQLLDIYNKYFHMMNYVIKPSEENDNDDNRIVFIHKKKSKNVNVLNNYYSINIINKKDPDETICIYGYATADSIGVHNKLVLPEDSIIKITIDALNEFFSDDTYSDAFRKFIASYLDNCTIFDVVDENQENVVRSIEVDYKLYNKLSRSKLIPIIKLFVKDSLPNMFSMVKFLLMNPNKKNIEIAQLLFDIVKSKKTGTNLVSDIIYKNLSFKLQMNLHKAALNIEQELERIRSLNTDDIDLRKQVILSKTMPDNVKHLVEKTLDNMESGSNEYGKQLMYVEDLIKFPWIGKDDDSYFEEINKSEKKTREVLDSIEVNLNQRVYGHKEGKLHIKELMGKWFKNPKAKGSVLGLCGPPGVGKTLIANSLGKALGIPLVKIPLGGQNDGEIIHGHGFTYSNARPGLIVKKMIEAGSPRCIMFFDELDKTCEKHSKNEIFNALLHVLDGNMNDGFMDKFFQNIKFPLSQVLFIFSYNDADLIDGILLDRITQIDIDPYSLKDKVNIARDYLIHEMTESFGFEKGSVKFDDKDYEYLTDQYTHEAGVRGLSRKLEKIFLKVNMDRIYKRSVCKDKKITKDDPVIITKELIHQYLEKPKLKIKKIHQKPLTGVINGLYATTSGRGGIIPIQIYNDHSGFSTEFSLRMTGSQGKVMKESVAYAYNTAVAHLKPTILDRYHKKHSRGLHIHTPSGATPKDGPSAGCAFATAFISRILDKKIRNDVAMTGEIDLSGNVTAIGGLVHKLRGAKKAGVKLVLVPKQNEDDFNKIIKDNVDLIKKDVFEVKLVETFRDVLEHVIIDFDDDDILDD